MGAAGTYKLVYLARRAPTVSRADWPRTWKSHAVFASRFPAIEGGLNWLRYCNRVDEPSIAWKHVELPQLSTTHDGVAVAGSDGLDGIRGGAVSPAIQAQIDEDERRVFDMLTPNFTFVTTEVLLKDGPLGKAALFQFLPRAKGVGREQFLARYGDQHAALARPVVTAVPRLTRSAVNIPLDDPLPLFPFDGISESWFETSDDAVRALAGGTFDGLMRDLASFCDLDRSVMMLTSVCHQWSEPRPSG